MVDPVNFTNFNRTDSELEEVLLFTILVAGKNALTTSRCLDNLLLDLDGISHPFLCLKKFSIDKLKALLVKFGFGCYNSKSKSIYQVVRSGFNLRTCTVDDLEEIHGIGKKSSRMYLLHTRPNIEVAALDTHILKYMSDLGFDVPKATPSSSKQYKQIEHQFIQLAKKAKMNVCDFDLLIWRKYSGRN